ncbi:MAG: 30S ribosome-binding factor RbfA [Anaerolineae bacterium]
MGTYRQERIAEMLTEELSLIIGFEMDDPRLEGVMVHAVKVSPDLRHARVYVSHPGEPVEDHMILEALQHAVGYLRRELAQRIVLKYVPELHFSIDRTEERAQRIEEILDHLKPTEE